MPRDWPDFPHHAQLLQYFHDYVDHFGLREKITFNTAVTDCAPLDGGRWAVTLSTGETREYDNLVVANGHHWDARLPSYPGTFDGIRSTPITTADPFEPYDFRGKSVIVVGPGNSAMDISSELSQRPIADNLFISMRRGVWVIPKYIDGKPADKASLPTWMPAKVGRSLARKKIRKTIGNMEDYGLPNPTTGRWTRTCRCRGSSSPASAAVTSSPRPGSIDSTATGWCSPMGPGSRSTRSSGRPATT